MKRLVLFVILIVCAISFTAGQAWSKKDGDPPVVKTSGGDHQPTSYIKF